MAFVSALVFSCSCLLSAINVAYADTTNVTNQDYFCSLYVCQLTYDPLYNSEAIYIPTAVKTDCFTIHAQSTLAYQPLTASSNVFYNDKTSVLYVNIGVDYSGSGAKIRIPSAGRYTDLQYQQYLDGNNDPWLVSDDAVYYRSVVRASNHNVGGLFRITIPGQCTQFRFNTPLEWQFPADTYIVSCYGSWIVRQDQAQYFDQILDYLESMDTSLTSQTQLLTAISNKLNQIYDTEVNIYTLLNDALHDESAQLSQDAQQAAEQIMMREDSEQYWSDKNTENYEAIGLNNFSFTEGFQGGLRLVGTIFGNIWNALGDYTTVIIFALTLGLALVVIGRIPRTKGGDKK